VEIFTEYGYIGLFAASFLAATILPLSSELVLGFLLMNQFDPVTSVIVATVGNVAGSFVNYFLGLYGGILFFSRAGHKYKRKQVQAEHYLKKYGVWSLLFAWVPVIGDPITVAAGVMKVNIVSFLLLVTAGKLFRYVFITMSLTGL
jgi:membrane protein YqaA with SNARE-associated domain